MRTSVGYDTGTNDRILLICTAAAGFLGLVSVFTGWSASLLSVILFGIVQLFAAVLSYCLFFRQKLYIAEKNRKEVSESAADCVREEALSGKEEAAPPSGEDKKTPQPQPQPYQLKTFLRRDYYIAIIAASVLGLYALIYVLRNLEIAVPVEGNFFLVGAAGIIISFCYMFGVNWLNFSYGEDREYEIIVHFLRASQVIAFAAGISVIIRAFGFYQVEYVLIIIISVLLAVSFLEVGLNAAGRLLAKPENDSIAIDLYVLPAFLSGKNPFTMLLLSLEKRSGITIRSAWTYGFLRRSIPPLFITAVIIFWLMTGLVQINTDEKAVKYRFGQLQEEVLLPGLHLKWPWPVETIRVLPAYGHHQFTVGYEGEPKSDYLWTSQHGGEEDIFLLGDGKELVSINMQVTYIINDLYNYLMQFETPDDVLQANAYEILMQEVVKSDLDELLSIDRAGLSRIIHNRLQKVSEEFKLGLEVVNIALTSIHPPVDIAREYQEFLGARIQKQILIIEALTDLNHNLPFGEETRNRLITEAKIEALDLIARAGSEEIKSAFQKKAYNANPEMYKSLKWLESFEDALEGRDIYLIVDEGDIWMDMRDISDEGVDVVE